MLLNVSLTGNVLTPTVGILDTNFNYNVYNLTPFFEKSVSQYDESFSCNDKVNTMECSVGHSFPLVSCFLLDLSKCDSVRSLFVFFFSLIRREKNMTKK
jgi:hypothetical protein